MAKNRTLLSPLNDPFILFANWLDEATLKEINDPNAMTLSTISNNLKSSSRIVLLKAFNNEGFVFYTNINSKKGLSILKNPNVALNFHWKSILKQVRIEGQIKQVTDTEANEYFNTRYEESKIGAWASKQSKELKDKKIFEKSIFYYKEKFKNKQIPRPSHWVGFRVKPDLIEFWQDMPFRLHDRLEFIKIDNKWNAKKLFP